jgi:hypothetical protein
MLAGLTPASAGTPGPITVTSTATGIVESATFTGTLAQFSYDCGTDPCPAASAFTVTGSVIGLAVTTPGDGTYAISGTVRPTVDSPILLFIHAPGGFHTTAAVEVLEAPIQATVGSVDVAPGQQVSGIFSYTDSGPSVDALTIAWGDGASDACTPSSGQGPVRSAINCSHSYAHAGTYAITGTVVDGSLTVSGTGTALVEPLVLGMTVPRRVRIRHRISFGVTPTVAAAVRGTATLLIPGRRHSIRLTSSPASAGHDQSVRVVFELSSRNARLLHAAQRRHKVPSLRVRITGTLAGAGVPVAVRSFRVPFAR